MQRTRIFLYRRVLSRIKPTPPSLQNAFPCHTHLARSLPLFSHTRPFFESARSLFGEPASSPPPPLPVVVLAGFLGAGKTTVLEQLLRENHGFKLGVIVNDLASVNVDAHVLRDAIKSSRTQSISLENGCVCCTAAADLKKSVQTLLKDGGPNRLDGVVIELSGVAEPRRAKRILEAPDSQPQWSFQKKSRPFAVRTVTVVDTPAFSSDYLGEQTGHHHHVHTDSGECDQRYGTLLAEQVESADLILMNKADAATDLELEQTQAMIRTLNEIATIRATKYGAVEVEEILGKKPEGVYRDEEVQDVAAPSPGVPAEKSMPSCCAAKTCSSTNQDSTESCEAAGEASEMTRTLAEKRFGITSFVYRTERLMNREKLLEQLNHWQKARDSLGNKLDLHGLSEDCSTQIADVAGRDSESTNVDSPLKPILRSKGILYMDADPNIAFYWSHAGKAINFSAFGPWPENISQSKGGFGPRRTELVFIGAQYREMAIRNILDSCLYSDEEMRDLHQQ